MRDLLAELRRNVAIGTVGGSDLAKQQEQLGAAGQPVQGLFDFCFAENGLTAFKSGEPLASHSFIKWLGEDKYKTLVNFILPLHRRPGHPRQEGHVCRVPQRHDQCQPHWEEREPAGAHGFPCLR